MQKKELNYFKMSTQTLKIITSSTVVLLLNACAVGPDYNGVPNIQYENLHNVNSNEDINNKENFDKWWLNFNDSELERIIEQVLKENLDLNASLARIEQARAVAQYAGAKLLPTVDFDTNASRIHQSLESQNGAIASQFSGYDRNTNLYNIGMGASWEIDLFGGLRRANEAAIAQAQVAEAAHLGTRISVTAEAADAYFQIKGLQKQLNITTDIVETNEKLLNLIKIRKEYGTANNHDIANTEARLKSAQANIPILKIALESQYNRLDILLGAQAGTYSNKLIKLNDSSNIPILTSSLSVNKLLHRRPDIIVAERKLAASNANIGVATSDYYPKFSISGLLGFESMNSSNLFESTTFQPQAIAGLKWRLFDFGKVDAQIKQAKGVYAEELALYKKSVLNATQDVENAFMALTQYKYQTELFTKKQYALNQTYELTQADFNEGISSLVEVLIAKNDLLLSDNELTVAKTNTFRSVVSSYRALGGGW
ncbi:efflux transporter outer membrane subunit [Aliarcobacter butzleri]|uniref:efflux transporter outer membrane subunit n=1 Tax=Aliarcobacter butzleri TaxID=28197 RepID=UPI00215A2481|nr:efflux transporter outer membrane subunit [Aliarcobacter butzleri]MCR8710439.1 efflux transporter outer membrane subunit [Aliarcobacter butzleri]